MREDLTPAEKRAERKAILKNEMDIHKQRSSLVTDEERRSLPPDKLTALAYNRWMNLRIKCRGDDPETEPADINQPITAIK